MLKIKRVSAAFLVLMLLLSAAPTLVSAAEGGENEESRVDEASKTLQRRVQVMLRIAERTADRIGGFIEKIRRNDVLLKSLEKADLLDDFNGNASAFEEAKDLLDKAKALIEKGNYTLAMVKVKEALTAFRGAYGTMHRIIGELTAVENQRKVEGLIVAVNRTLERLEEVERLAGEADGETSDIIQQARELLNLTEIRALIKAGNVSEAAHRLAEAGRLTAKAFKALKAKAEERLAQRTERFLEMIKYIQRKVAEKIRNAGFNASEILEGAGLGNFSGTRQRILEKIRSLNCTAIRKIIRRDLKAICIRLHRMRKTLPLFRVVEKPKIKDILSNPKIWINKTVFISGVYYGWKSPKGISGPNYTGPPETRSDWIISDGTGWIYVTGGRIPIGWMHRAEKHRRFESSRGAMRVAVIGTVKVKIIKGSTVPYIHAKLALILPGTAKVLEENLGNETAVSKHRHMLMVSVHVKIENETVLVTVKVTNKANGTVVFPNEAYGVVIERKIGDEWKIYKKPLSIRKSAELKPGESANVTVKMHRPPAGAYRVVSAGWLKKTHQPVTGFAEFSLP
ncbi:hypothetical protein B6U84_03185 [Candidatus Bathyarchaeota archaeon ex4484_40]|mgnify:CR=1 FL=1|nr:MAG: hypothetical protein B6U84_03185 [Candidatus Bathyarchaeota archaeon ex4484_40]